MRIFLLFLVLLYSHVLTAQVVSSTVTKDLDTLVITKAQKNKTIKVGTITYKDSTIVYDTTVTSLKKYVPPVIVPDPMPTPGQTINLSFTAIPFSDPDILSPGRGSEQWHNGSAWIPYPTPTTTTQVTHDVYYRFVWNQVEKGQGVYDWTYLDGLIKSAINKGQKLSFGIMSHRGETGADGALSYGGAISYYPAYLHNLMQSEVSTSRDWVSNGIWVPNFNSLNYISRLEALNKATSDHLLTTRYTPTSGPHAGKSILLSDAIYCIDIRGFGTWGEWHTSSGMANWSAFPSGRVPTAESLKKIIDAHTKVLNDWWLVMMIAAYDGGSSQFPVFAPYPEVAWYAINARNAKGAVGFRKDQWGARDEYLAKLAETNNVTYNGSLPFKNYILDKWKTAPVTGEPMPGTYADMSDLERQVRLYHATSVGNGNYGATPNTTQQNYIRNALKASGYRIEIKGGKVETSAGSISITLNWQNVGIAPTYENWDVWFELVNSSGVVVASKQSMFTPRLFPPHATPTSVTDNITTSITGTYTLRVVIKDPSGYRAPLPLAIQGRQSNGSYNLATVQL